MDLTHMHHVELIKLALNERAGWVPSGPLNTARHRKLHYYSRANTLADLESAGLVVLTKNKSGDKYTVRLSEAGKDTVRAMPADLNVEWYPLPEDIAEAKEKLKREIHG